jgi:hypothetical protein
MLSLLDQPAPTKTYLCPVANFVLRVFLNKGHLKEMEDPLQLLATFDQEVKDSGK